MNPNVRSIRREKNHWRAQRGTRHNGGRTGRVKEGRQKGSRRGR